MNEIKAETVSYSYPFCTRASLEEVSFSLKKGEAMLVTGASGCGKSTLLRVLNGLAPNHFKGTLEGSIAVMDLSFPAPLEEVSSRVGTVLQNPEEQIMATTVQEEIALALEWQCVPQDEIRRRVAKSLEDFGLSSLATRSVFHLSSGERQKCVLAAVAAAGTNVVVMDEPTANLSPEATEDLAKICLELKRRGTTIVIADHRLYWLRGVLDKVMVLRNGRCVFTADNSRGDPLEAISPELGLRRLDVQKPSLPDTSADAGAAVSVRNLSFRYSRKTEWLYRDFSADIPKGAITAVVGDNGAGKTTLARLLCGLLKPSSGEILFAGGQKISAKARRKRTAFVMQQMDIQLYAHTVEEELFLSAPRSTPKPERQSRAAHWLDVFGLSHLKNRHPHSLSGGEKQRLVVACALMKQPDLLILDEPTSGLDGHNMRIIARELKTFASNGGAVLLITHDLELLQLVADRKLEVVKKGNS